MKRNRLEKSMRAHDSFKSSLVRKWPSLPEGHGCGSTRFDESLLSERERKIGVRLLDRRTALIREIISRRGPRELQNI